ncbi:hypothetical protein [Streptomyces sp. NPDC088156]
MPSATAVALGTDRPYGEPPERPGSGLAQAAAHAFRVAHPLRLLTVRR